MGEPDSAARLEELGNAHHAQGRLEDAILAYREALEREPGRTGALWGLGCAQASLGDHASAAESLAGSWSSSPITARGITTWADPCMSWGKSIRRSRRSSEPSTTCPPRPGPCP